MANATIDQLPGASPITGAELIPLAQIQGAGYVTVNSPGSSLVSNSRFAMNPASSLLRSLLSRLQDTVSVLDFGADPTGTNDSTTAIQNAINAAASLGNMYVLFPYGNYRLTAGISIDISKVGLFGCGASLSWTSMTSGTAITILNSSTVNVNNSRLIQGLIFIGPGVTTTAVNCMVVNINHSPYFSGLIVRDCLFQNFSTSVSLFSGSFFCLFENCIFTETYGSATTYSVVQPSGYQNAGERNVFRNCTWTNLNYIYNQGNGDTFFFNCSFDGGLGRAMNVTGGGAYLVGCHVEIYHDNDYWFASSNGGLIQLSNCSVGSANAHVNFSPFYSDSSNLVAGIIIKDTSIYFANAFSVPLVGGTGPTLLRDNKMGYGGSMMALSAAQNNLAYGGFESTSYTDEWALSSGAIRSNAQAHTGTYSLSFPASSGVTPTAKMSFPCSPGQVLFADMWYMVSNITGSGGTFYANITFLDAAGNSLSGGGSPFTINTNVASWTHAVQPNPVPAPAGTRSAQLAIDIFGVTSGTPTGYVDDINICAA